jgi:dienelactone hydrolase
VARATLPRRVTPAAVGLRRLTVRRDGVYGDLFTPRNSRPHPAVLLFGGSDGGNTMVDQAGLLAAHGNPTLAMAYFAAPGVPKHLLDIPLEYFARAARLLRHQPHVTRVVPMGVSRGGEAALLIASKFPRLLRGAIGLVPSSQVSGSTYRFDRPAWTYRGRPLAAGTQIAVERISGPILTAGAGEDTVWDSALWVHEIEQRLRDRHFRFLHTAVTYQRAGHLAGVALPYLPAPTVQDQFGGSARADAAAKADLWPRILRFLAALSPPRG